MRVLFIDPGKKTGISLFDSQLGEVAYSHIIPGGLKGFKEWWHEIPASFASLSIWFDVLGCESFELEEDKYGVDYEDPLQIIHWLRELDIPIVWQRRMERGKSKICSVAVLKRAGLYPKRGELKEGHQVAALQHALSFLIDQGDRATIQLLHPKD